MTHYIKFQCYITNAQFFRRGACRESPKQCIFQLNYRLLLILPVRNTLIVTSLYSPFLGIHNQSSDPLSETFSKTHFTKCMPLLGWLFFTCISLPQAHGTLSGIPKWPSQLALSYSSSRRPAKVFSRPLLALKRQNPKQPIIFWLGNWVISHSPCFQRTHPHYNSQPLKHWLMCNCRFKFPRLLGTVTFRSSSYLLHFDYNWPSGSHDTLTRISTHFWQCPLLHSRTTIPAFNRS